MLCLLGDWESHLWQTRPDFATDTVPLYSDPSSSALSTQSGAGVNLLVIIFMDVLIIIAKIRIVSCIDDRLQ